MPEIPPIGVDLRELRPTQTTVGFWPSRAKAATLQRRPAERRLGPRSSRDEEFERPVANFQAERNGARRDYAEARKQAAAALDRD